MWRWLWSRRGGRGSDGSVGEAVSVGVTELVTVAVAVSVGETVSVGVAELVTVAVAVGVDVGTRRRRSCGSRRGRDRHLDSWRGCRRVRRRHTAIREKRRAANDNAKPRNSHHCQQRQQHPTATSAPVYLCGTTARNMDSSEAGWRLPFRIVHILILVISLDITPCGRNKCKTCYWSASCVCSASISVGLPINARNSGRRSRQPGSHTHIADKAGHSE